MEEEGLGVRLNAFYESTKHRQNPVQGHINWLSDSLQWWNHLENHQGNLFKQRVFGTMVNFLLSKECNKP